MTTSNRAWMYQRLEDGLIRWEYAMNVKTFIAFAKSQTNFLDGHKIRCPCNRKKCHNRAFHDEDTVEYHLIRYGFVPDYYKWVLHGEQLSDEEDEDDHRANFTEDGNTVEAEDVPAPEAASTSYHEMIHDLACNDSSLFNLTRPGPIGPAARIRLARIARPS